MTVSGRLSTLQVIFIYFINRCDVIYSFGECIQPSAARTDHTFSIPLNLTEIDTSRQIFIANEPSHNALLFRFIIQPNQKVYNIRNCYLNAHSYIKDTRERELIGNSNNNEVIVLHNKLFCMIVLLLMLM